MSEISQPIRSVLQIALVDELRSWGVAPLKVIDHSSEIGAAYTIGALSHRDALAAAYFRGQASAGIQNGLGGMMAVGCSKEEAQRLISKRKLEVTVACVNSPSSVTLSGDVTSLELLRDIFDQQGTFARRLKVDVAYHSSHMHTCSGEYYGAISNLEPGMQEIAPESQQRSQPVMVSSVTGMVVDPEFLGPYYWIQNLISPDALKEMVGPAGVESENNKDIDLLIEIGPHSALGGPIEQTLSHHGIRDVAYASMLRRGQSALNTSLKLVANLFLRGVALDMRKVNGDSHCHLLSDIQPYPWNHSEEFRADSRIQRELVAQQYPTRSLLGLPLARMDENERIWRGFIRLNDESWLRDHRVGTTVVFPGAGTLSIVLEAAQQIVETSKTPHSFKMRDVSFLAAMVLPENTATEVITHMRPGASKFAILVGARLSIM